MIKVSRWRSQGRQKSMCFAAKGWLQGRAAKLLLARWGSRPNDDYHLGLTANGPAIKGGCVTRRSAGQVMVMFGQETVTVQGRYGACFCCPGTS